METRQITPFFFIYFFRSNCIIHFWIWKYSKLVPPLVHSGLKNISIFGQKLPIQTAHHAFLESRLPDVTKNLYYALPTHWTQIPIFLRLQLMDYKGFDASFTFWDTSFSEVIKLIKTLNAKKASQKTNISTNIGKLNADFFGNFICKNSCWHADMWHMLMLYHYIKVILH